MDHRKDKGHSPHTKRADQKADQEGAETMIWSGGVPDIELYWILATISGIPSFDGSGVT
jgi:hypothetical protein